MEQTDLGWQPAKGGLMTRWAGEVDPGKVLPEYPRPQMVRDNWINLNGLWDYAIRPKNENEVTTYEGQILVPFPIESALSGVKRSLLQDERLWYKRTFFIPDEWKGQNILLHFGAVDWKTEVRINRHPVGEHTGGYYPFTFEISQYLSDGENEIVVAVWDPTDTFGQERGKQKLNPEGLFYTPISGIWQTVWLEPVPKNYITWFRLTPDIDSGELSVAIQADNNENSEFEAIVYAERERIVSGKTKANDILKLKISNPRLWSPDSPFLYDIAIRLVNNNHPVDEIRSYFGMRKFSIGRDPADGKKRLFLNNEPLFQNGVLDQGYWPDGLYTAPTDEALAFDIGVAKKLGFNMIRKHIKVEPARWYYHCDRLGLIVWQDMINGGAGMNILHNVIIPNLTDGIKIKDNKYRRFGRNEMVNRENYRKELKEMIDSLYNVPSIGMWVPFNEAWGQFAAGEIAEWVGKYDSTRCVDHASGWYDQGIGEIKSVHRYIFKLKMPRGIKGRTVVISEYGGYSLLEKGHVWREDKEIGYKKFTTKDQLTAAYQTLINDQLKPLIPKGVSAVVYTQLTDVETEINGLLTYDREIIKTDMDLVNQLNRSCTSSLNNDTQLSR